MENLAFLLRVYRRLWRHAGRWLLVIVLLKLLSLASLLISLLLPWQLLMAIDGRAFHYAAWVQQEDSLVPLMGAAIVVAFVLHLFAEWAVKVAAGVGAQRVLQAHAKTGLFTNYRVRAKAMFQDMALGLAALVMALAVMAALCVVYPRLALGLLVYFLAWVLLWPVLERLAPDWWARMKEGPVFKLGWYAGFVFLLIWAVASYDPVSALPLHWLFICVLAARQVVLQVFQALAAWRRLLLNRSKAAVLFLPQVDPRQYERPSQTSFDQRLLQLAQPSPWIDRLLHEARAGKRAGAARAVLAETGTVAYVIVPVAGRGGGTCADGVDRDAAAHPGSRPDACLIKFYSASKQAVGEHEQSLLAVVQPHWPAPAVLHAESSSEGASSVWAWENSAVWLNASQRKTHDRELRQLLLACDLPAALIQRYQRAHGDLAVTWANGLDWARMRSLASNTDALRRVEWLAREQAGIQACLAQLPAQLVLPSLRSRRMARTGSGKIVLCNWTRWHWLPVGAGWPLEVATDDLLQALAWASAWRPCLAGVAPAHVRLAVAVQALYQAAQSHDYVTMEQAVACVEAAMAGEAA